MPYARMQLTDGTGLPLHIMYWYNILPYELLEIHPAGSTIRLPGEVVAHYVRPYFEAHVWAAMAGNRLGRVWLVGSW